MKNPIKNNIYDILSKLLGKNIYICKICIWFFSKFLSFSANLEIIKTVKKMWLSEIHQHLRGDNKTNKPPDDRACDTHWWPVCVFTKGKVSCFRFPRKNKHSWNSEKNSPYCKRLAGNVNSGLILEINLKSIEKKVKSSVFFNSFCQTAGNIFIKGWYVTFRIKYRFIKLLENKKRQCYIVNKKRISSNIYVHYTFIICGISTI